MQIIIAYSAQYIELYIKGSRRLLHGLLAGGTTALGCFQDSGTWAKKP